MLVLLSGPIGSGKTTLCQRAVAVARQRELAIGGILTPAIVKDGVKMGIRAVDLGSGEVRPFACCDRDLGGTRIGRYSFDDETFRWVLSCCTAALAGDAMVFVDEIGRLELEGGTGLAPLLPILARPREGHTVVVILDPTERDLAWRALQDVLFDRGTDVLGDRDEVGDVDRH